MDNRPFTITFDPADSKVFWEAGGYGGHGVFGTRDGGQTFDQLGGLEHIQQVAVDFTDPTRSTLVAISHETPGFFRSHDGGQSWQTLTGSLPQVGFLTGVVAVDANTYLIGTTSNGGIQDTDGIYRTTDGGVTWTRVFPVAVVGSPLTSGLDGSVYWILADAKGLVRTTNGGVDWTRVSANAVFSPSANALAEMPDGTLLGVGRTNLIASNDHGATWQATGPALPFNATTMTYSAQRSSAYVAAGKCDLSDPAPKVDPQSVMRLEVTSGAG